MQVFILEEMKSQASRFHGFTRVPSNSPSDIVSSHKALPAPINNPSIYAAIQRTVRRNIIEEKIK